MNSIPLSNMGWEVGTYILENKNIRLSDKTILNMDVDNPPLIIVKFIIDNASFATRFKVHTTIGEIKSNLADVLELEEDWFDIFKDDVVVEKAVTLAELCVQLYSKMVFEIGSLKGEDVQSTILAQIRKNIPTLDVITVHLGEAGDNNDIVVDIETRCCQKEWLGGYRNKLTNIEYHNAETQTSPKRREVFKYSESGEAIPLIFHRDTQTPFKLKEVTQSTVVNKATQMWRSDLFISSTHDKILTSRTYVDHDQWLEENTNINAIITVQNAIRRWIRGRKIHNLIKLQRTIIDDLKKQKLQILKEQADKTRIIITGAAYPVKRDDFYMLYLMVGDWWKKEWKKVCALKFPETKRTEAVALLTKEVQLLEAIEKNRIVGKQEALKKEKMRFLEQTSRPLAFKNRKGLMASIDNLETQRAREFKEIYSALFGNNILLSKDMIDVLITLKQAFLTHFMDYEYCNDLVSLIEQEIDLLSIGTKQYDLRGLHKRIEQLFMHFLQQKEFNTKASKYKKPNLPKTLHTLFLCIRCKKLLPASMFPVHVRMMSYSACKSCVWLQNIGYQRADMSPYLKLLKHVQNTEMEKCCHSAVCFILQPIGMCYLTNVIWHGHSAISECRDMSKLQHIRWQSDIEWAPWNTILLTDLEAKCHACIPNVLNFYGKTFIENVRRRHILARACFIPLLKMNHDISTSGVWSNIKDSGPFLHPSHAEIFASENEYDKV
uniref:IQ motif and ubiquitin-like domain-containing protein n=1 Tax=Graphocephala atropunctata TaxID=36148 RepID=A0A1B6LAI9_9HEMI